MKRSVRKRHEIRKKKSIFKKPVFWSLFLFSFLVAGGIYFFVFFEKFQISKITVLGNGKVQTSAVEKLISAGIEQRFWFVSSRSIFLVNPGKISRIILEKYPVIGSVEIKKQYFNALIVNIKERKPFVIFCEKTENCFFLDESSVAFEGVANIVEGFSIVRQFEEKEIVLGKEVVKKEIMEAISKIQKNFEENLKLKIEEFNISSSERLDVKTNENWQVYFSTAFDIDLQITKLNYLLEKELPKENRVELQYIDLRFKDRAYYK